MRAHSTKCQAKVLFQTYKQDTLGSSLERIAVIEIKSAAYSLRDQIYDRTKGTEHKPSALCLIAL